MTGIVTGIVTVITIVTKSTELPVHSPNLQDHCVRSAIKSMLTRAPISAGGEYSAFAVLHSECGGVAHLGFCVFR
jgi:hypothetical protein